MAVNIKSIFALFTSSSTIANLNIEGVYNSKTAQKTNIIFHKYSFCSLIDMVESQWKKLSSLGEMPEGALEWDENLSELCRKAMVRLVLNQTA